MYYYLISCLSKFLTPIISTIQSNDTNFHFKIRTLAELKIYG